MPFSATSSFSPAVFAGLGATIASAWPFSLVRSACISPKRRTAVVFTGVMSLGRKMGFRYLSPVIPFLCLLAGTGLATVDADARFLCMHHTVSGATVGPSGHVFRSGPDVVPMKELPATLTAVLSGHIHRRQELRREGRPPVFYPGSIERTSFAERDEAKGFLDITVAVPEGEPARVVRSEFVELPARPMVDVELPACLAAADVAAYLASEGRRHPKDAVVRISAAAPAPGVVAQLTADRLRAAFPPSMNVQLARGLFDAFE